MDIDDLDENLWDDDTYLQRLDEREVLIKKINAIHRNVLDTTSDRRLLFRLEESIEAYRQKLIATEAQYT